MSTAEQVAHAVRQAGPLHPLNMFACVSPAAVGDGLTSHWNIEVNHIMTITASGMALLCGGALLGIAWAVDPTMKAFPCLPRWMRKLVGLAAIGCGVRAVGLITSASSPLTLDPNHIHPDIVMGWTPMLALFVGVFIYVMSQKLDPHVRARLERKQARDMVSVRRATRVGGPALGLVAASGVLDEINPTLPREPLDVDANLLHALEAMP